MWKNVDQLLHSLTLACLGHLGWKKWTWTHRTDYSQRLTSKSSAPVWGKWLPPTSRWQYRYSPFIKGKEELDSGNACVNKSPLIKNSCCLELLLIKNVCDDQAQMESVPTEFWQHLHRFSTNFEKKVKTQNVTMCLPPPACAPQLCDVVNFFVIFQAKDPTFTCTSQFDWLVANHCLAFLFH